ncbi:MAG TPA: NAAT family transporter [Acidiferrobacteraceae bacterium]|nr:NAAT family transporter [Acidiferrobacteraceae bacterium]HEX20702.1 NAAT family transporter [Acidiferrobacteraceae bacterium]
MNIVFFSQSYFSMQGLVHYAVVLVKTCFCRYIGPMSIEYLKLGKEFLSLFTILAPFSVLPVYVSLTQTMPEQARRRALRRTLLVSLATLLIFQWSGLYFFRGLGIELPSFQIAGGLIIASMAWSMLHAHPSRIQRTHTEDEESQEKDDFSIVPLAIPMISGPGAITTVMLLSQQQKNFVGDGLLTGLILISILLLYPIFLYAHPALKKMGVTGMRVMTRIMGMILLAIAVEFIAQGVIRSLPFLG